MKITDKVRIGLSLPADVLVSKITSRMRRRASLQRIAAIAQNVPAHWRLQDKSRGGESLLEMIPYQSAISAYAAEIMAGRLGILGSGSLSWRSEGGLLDWYYDPVADFTFRAMAATVKSGADVKLPLEAGRCHHLVTIAVECALGSGGEEAADYLDRSISDFAERCPVGIGIQWMSGIDVGIRAYNLVLAWQIMSLSNAVSPRMADVLPSLLFAHGVWLTNRLENITGINTSHYIGNLLGLLAIGTSCIGQDADRWRMFAVKELDAEIDKQFLADGMNFEASTAYHRHVADMYIHALRLLMSPVCDSYPNIGYVRDRWRTRVQDMTGAWMSFEHDTGLFPVIGDNDSGMAVRLEARPDAAFSFSIAGHLNAVGARQHVLDSFGLVRMDNTPLSLWLRAGSIGQHGKGGHAHNDQCSVSIAWHGVPVIVDAGTVTYTRDPSLRNRCRSAAMHSQLYLHREPVEFPSDDGEGLFWMFSDRTSARVEAGKKASAASCDVYGRHYRRTVHMEGAGFYIMDECEMQGVIQFLCSGKVEIEGTTAIVQTLHGSFYITGKCTPCLESALMSPDYGIQLPATLVRFPFEGGKHITMVGVSR